MMRVNQMPEIEVDIVSLPIKPAMLRGGTA
jgi:hypothetical protein